jgi:C-terminal processing protease CtpA/Prc
MKKDSITIPLVFLLTGFIAAYFIFEYSSDNNQNQTPLKDTGHAPVPDRDSDNITNPFIIKNISVEGTDSGRLAALEAELTYVKQQLRQLEQSLQTLTNAVDKADADSAIAPSAKRKNETLVSALRLRLFNLDNLIKGGIDPSLAEDIIRRKNSVELKRLELQDRATRENYRDTDKYYDELEEINLQEVNLREELGDERYDDYLYNSKQNNRVKIVSVMLGSAAELAGIQKSDIVLSYDNNQMFTWRELKNATTEGELGEYVSISIIRNGQIYSYSVPRGPLGVQLGATRLQP